MPTTNLKSAEEWRAIWLADKRRISDEEFEVLLTKRIHEIQLNALEFAVEIVRTEEMRRAGMKHMKPIATAMTRLLLTQIEELKRK